MLRSLFSAKFFIPSLLIMGLMIAGCKSGPEEVDEIVIDDDYYEFQSFSLAKYEIPATIFLPDETANIGASTKPEVEHYETDIKWSINVGPNFQMLIEDYGDITDLIESKKKELAEQKFFKVNYIVDDKDMIVYERTLVVGGSKKASPTVGIEHKSYHVYAQKAINGFTYEFKSREEGHEKLIIELMAKSIRSIKPTKK